MQAYHGFDWNDEKEPSTGKRAASAAKTPPLKKRKPETEQSAQMTLLRWIVSSFQPWSTVESPVFQDFACCLCASFDVPTKDEMISIAIENVEKVKVEVRRRLKDCGKYSIGCLPFTHQNKAYTSVTVTFCTPTFERETVSLGLITGKCTTATVTSLLSEFSLSPNNVSCVTVTGGPEHTNLGIGRHGVSCVLFRMEKIVEEECKSNVATNGVISFVLSKFSHMCSTSFVQRLYTSLQTALGSDIDWDGNAGQKMVARALSSILKPFYDANITLSGELYPTVGLTIPVSRRIRDIVSKLDVAQLTTECNDKTAVFRIKEFCTSLLKQFSASFGSVLAEDPVLMWTVPLDPRLIHMGGLSKNEQESVTKMLVDKVKEKKRAATDANVASAEGAEDNGGSKVLPKAQESSTMGGIFWGDDAQDAANQNEAEATYAKSNVDRYFTSVKSQRRIEDPLDWWNTNQQDFPELAGMAREWLAASAVGPSVDEREKYPEGNIELMAFLHDNAHLIAGFDDKKTSKTSQKK